MQEGRSARLSARPSGRAVAAPDRGPRIARKNRQSPAKRLSHRGDQTETAEIPLAFSARCAPPANRQAGAPTSSFLREPTSRLGTAKSRWRPVPRRRRNQDRPMIRSGDLDVRAKFRPRPLGPPANAPIAPHSGAADDGAPNPAAWSCGRRRMATIGFVLVFAGNRSDEFDSAVAGSVPRVPASGTQRLSPPKCPSAGGWEPSQVPPHVRNEETHIEPSSSENDESAALADYLDPQPTIR